ncbi:TPA: hypothetical protein UL920_004170 [Stenotrophomonas maltophilia]|nr:hypothetical protein [Stenotrophomonas maltophilia]HEL4860641.1 hypothetical protein [Stenotrophomonas maltophilia]HEL7632499.1 hypothetical protein [Stenotrophomonas maltophilia]HEL7636160.1 hypothetical protein [Stenotrophomonas maltophilia]
MTTEKTPATLGTAKHGGCVQLPTSERERFEAWAEGNNYEMEWTGLRYVEEATKDAWLAWQAAISAQPSPAGQVDAWAIKLARESAFAHSNEHAYLPQTRQETNRWQPHEWVVAAIQAAALGVPQPVGQITDAEIDARLSALYREMVDSGQHNGGMSGVAWDRAVFRMAVSQPAQAVYTSAPAQAVDRGAVLEALQAAEGLAPICASVDGYSREELAASGRAMRQQFADALAKVDSQAVGSG